MITAIILNWNRLDGVRQICSQLNEFQYIGEVVVWNNNPEAVIELGHDKVKVVNCSVDFGLFTRFAAASLAKNECILFHDDDLVAPEETLNALYRRWKSDPDICHSPFGRNPKQGRYSFGRRFGQVDIVLTRYVLVHRKIAVHALSRIPEFSDLPGVPVGNGEDIILSYASIDYSGKLNRSYRLETKDIIEDDERSISVRFPGHVDHRSRIIQRCKENFRTNSRPTLVRGIHKCVKGLRIVWNRNLSRRVR